MGCKSFSSREPRSPLTDRGLQSILLIRRIANWTDLAMDQAQARDFPRRCRAAVALGDCGGRR